MKELLNCTIAIYTYSYCEAVYCDVENVDDGDVCHDISKCDVLTSIRTKCCRVQAQRKLVEVIRRHVPIEIDMGTNT